MVLSAFTTNAIAISYHIIALYVKDRSGRDSPISLILTTEVLKVAHEISRTTSAISNLHV